MQTMTAIPRYRSHFGPVILSAGFRPFFLGASIWAAASIPLWLGAYAEGLALPTKLAQPIWHAHDIVFGYAAATVAGFLLTAIPNWTGRMPLQGGALATLVLLWVIGRLGVLLSGEIAALPAAAADLCFPAVFLAVVAREILAGKNWRNLPMLGALSLLLLGNLLVHIDTLDLVDTAEPRQPHRARHPVHADLAGRRPDRPELHAQLAGKIVPRGLAPYRRDASTWLRWS